MEYDLEVGIALSDYNNLNMFSVEGGRRAGGWLFISIFIGVCASIMLQTHRGCTICNHLALLQRKHHSAPFGVRAKRKYSEVFFAISSLGL